jgi:oligoendopeptidase F
LKLKNKDVFINSRNLAEFLKDTEEIEKFLGSLSFYATNLKNVDLANALYITKSQKIENLLVEYSKKISFYNPSLLREGKDKMIKFISEQDFLKQYEFDILNTYRYEKHTLSEHDNKLLSELSDCFPSIYTFVNLLKDKDIKFGKIKDDEGELKELTLNNYEEFILSKDRSVRKNAELRRNEVLGSYKTTFTEFLYQEYKSNKAWFKVHNYEDYLDYFLKNDKVNKDVIYNLINTVNKNLSSIHNYEKLRKETLQLDDYSSYDSAVPLTENVKKYTIEEAKDLVLKATAILGEDYQKNIKKAMDERWVDFYPNRDKTSGAYSYNLYTTHPYVLMNYTGTLTDVSTLAHELGHSMHSVYSNTQPYVNADYSLMVAEVASTVNELLLYNYMLDHSESNEEKAYILNQLLDMIDGTLFRQTMFLEFESFAHELVKDELPFTSDSLGEKYYSLLKKYSGTDVNVSKESNNSWVRVDHFYYSFYVYKYATGVSSSLAIVKGILEGKENKENINNYLKFLKLGGSDYPLDELKVAGVDLENPKVIEDAVESFNDYLEQFKQVLEEVKNE